MKSKHFTQELRPAAGMSFRRVRPAWACILAALILCSQSSLGASDGLISGRTGNLRSVLQNAPSFPEWRHDRLRSIGILHDSTRPDDAISMQLAKRPPRMCIYSTANQTVSGAQKGAVTALAEKQTWTRFGLVSTLYGLDAGAAQWQPILGPEVMLRASANGYETGCLSSIDALAIPEDFRSAGGTQLAAAHVTFTQASLDAQKTSCTQSNIYLYERDAKGAWVSAPGFGVVSRSWSTLENARAVDNYMFTGSVAMAADRTGMVHIFWTQWTGDPGGGSWNQYQVIKHMTYDPANNTRQANPDAISAGNAKSHRQLIDIHYGRALAAAMDDNIHQDGRISVTWPQIIEGDSAATVKQGWYDPNQKIFQDRASVAPEMPLANFKYRNTAITVADINNASDFLDWLKSAALNMSFKTGAGGLAGWLGSWGSGAFYTRRGERVGGNDIWDAWIGSPDGATAPTQRVSPVAVAARGSRTLREAALTLMTPQWGGESRITDYGSYTLSADGVTKIRNGENPVLEANSGGYIDQVLAAHPYSLTMWEEGSIGSEQYYTSGTIFVVTPVRP